MGISPRGHDLIELNDYPGVEKLAWSHEGLQGVLLHKLHSVSKLGEGDESWKIIKVQVVQILSTTVGIAWNRATVEGKPSDKGARGQVLRTAKGWALRW